MEKLKASNFPDGIELVQMDVCKPSSIQGAVDSVLSKAGHIGEYRLVLRVIDT
jgi:hypothetical protein